MTILRKKKGKTPLERELKGLYNDVNKKIVKHFKALKFQGYFKILKKNSKNLVFLE